MPRFHIAHFTNTYLPFINGVSRSVENFRRGLTELGHNVFIFAPDADAYEDTVPFVFRYPAIELPLQKYPLTIPVSTFIDKLLPALKLDVLHAHHPALLGQVAAKKAQELDVPLVFTHHTRYRDYSHYVAALPQNLVKDVIDRWVVDYMTKCQHVVVPSESIRAMLIDRYGITERVSVVPTGVDVARFHEANGRFLRQKYGWQEDIVLISAGRLAAEKNWPTLLEAFRLLLPDYPQCRLVILGDGPERKNLENLCRNLGIEKRVVWMGQVPFEEMPVFLKAANIFCFASVTETQGMVTLEAMAAGLPVVAVRASGTADFITDGQEGFLTPNDSSALAEALKVLLTDNGRCQQFGQAAYAKAQQFTIYNQAQKMETVYQQAIADKKAGYTIQADPQKPIFRINWQKYLGVNLDWG
ncbi:MAG: glycosyltransferase family 4 protein [Chloroflexi bacterium]|nr:MAG: glycosyltransferase family 4 protein [Chloroflexota bacterium]